MTVKDLPNLEMIARRLGRGVDMIINVILETMIPEINNSGIIRFLNNKITEIIDQFPTIGKWTILKTLQRSTTLNHKK